MPEKMDAFLTHFANLDDPRVNVHTSTSSAQVTSYTA